MQSGDFGTSGVSTRDLATKKITYRLSIALLLLESIADSISFEDPSVSWDVSSLVGI